MLERKSQAVPMVAKYLIFICFNNNVNNAYYYNNIIQIL